MAGSDLVNLAGLWPSNGKSGKFLSGSAREVKYYEDALTLMNQAYAAGQGLRFLVFPIPEEKQKENGPKFNLVVTIDTPRPGAAKNKAVGDPFAAVSGTSAAAATEDEDEISF